MDRPEYSNNTLSNVTYKIKYNLNNKTKDNNFKRLRTSLIKAPKLLVFTNDTSKNSSVSDIDKKFDLFPKKQEKKRQPRRVQKGDKISNVPKAAAFVKLQNAPT